MPRPKWFSTSPKLISPSSTLEKAAKVIKEDAKEYRKCGLHDEARAVDRIAGALLRVANGEAWEAAFEFPAPKKST